MASISRVAWRNSVIYQQYIGFSKLKGRLHRHILHDENSLPLHEQVLYDQQSLEQTQLLRER